MKFNDKSRVTKITKIRYVDNCMTTNWYYLVNCRLYIDERYYQRVKFVMWYDAFEIQDYFPSEEYGECITEKMHNEYKNEIAQSTFEMLCNMDSMEDIIEWCNDTINDYNK